MIIVPIKEGDNVERALKKFKRKFEKNWCNQRTS
jgi:ribosomal protein S21